MTPKMVASMKEHRHVAGDRDPDDIAPFLTKPPRLDAAGWERAMAAPPSVRRAAIASGKTPTWTAAVGMRSAR